MINKTHSVIYDLVQSLKIMSEEGSAYPLVEIGLIAMPVCGKDYILPYFCAEIINYKSPSPFCFDLVSKGAKEFMDVSKSKNQAIILRVTQSLVATAKLINECETKEIRMSFSYVEGQLKLMIANSIGVEPDLAVVSVNIDDKIYAGDDPECDIAEDIAEAARDILSQLIEAEGGRAPSETCKPDCLDYDNLSY